MHVPAMHVNPRERAIAILLNAVDETFRQICNLAGNEAFAAWCAYCSLRRAVGYLEAQR